MNSQTTALFFGAKNHAAIHANLRAAGIVAAEVVTDPMTVDFDFDGGPVRGQAGTVHTYYRNEDIATIVKITRACSGYVWAE
jgi:hypothetical protein